MLPSCWLIQALAERDLITADSVSYLDIGYSCLAGNWHALVNGWWSPGYPFLLAIWLKIFAPSPFHEGVVIHLLAFASLIVALLSFEYFMTEFFVYRKKIGEQYGEEGSEGLSEELIRLVAYCLFFWVTTFQTPPYLEQPDILVFILYLIATALCMQLMTGREQWTRYALLGVVLGLGYLAKAVMLPLAFVFFLALMWRRNRLRFPAKLLLSMAVFVAVCLPFCLALSQSKGRITFGDVGVLAYRHVMGMDEETLPTIAGPRPAATPHIKEYTQIIELGTYPPWADASYGYKGGPIHFNLRRQLNRTHVVLTDYFNQYVVGLGALLTGFLVLLFLSDWRQFCVRFLRHAVLWLPAIAGMAFYATMRVEGRFLAGNTVCLFAACAAAISGGGSASLEKMARPIASAVSVMLMAVVIFQVGHEGVKLLGHQKHSEWQVATALHSMGVIPGDRVSYLGDALYDDIWAHLARVRIAAEIPQEDVLNFWAAGSPEREEALAWVRATGARALVTKSVPDAAMAMGWRRVGDTDYFILLLSGRK